MRKIPFTRAVIVTRREAESIHAKLIEASRALADSAMLNVALVQDLTKAAGKNRELAGYIVDQSEVVRQIMQINLLTTGALGRVRGGEDVEEVIKGLEASLQEFSSSE